MRIHPSSDIPSCPPAGGAPARRPVPAAGMRGFGRRLRRRIADTDERGDRGTSLVELCVALAVQAALIGGLVGFFSSTSSTAASAHALTASQQSVHAVMTVLEADVASADPLTLVPASFTADPAGSSSSGSAGTSPTDIVAMVESPDLQSACPPASSTTSSSSTTTTMPPSPFEQSVTSANVVWAYDPASGQLTRYSWCASGGTWRPGLAIGGIVDPAKTMFQAIQLGAATHAQVPTPSSTTVPNEAAPVCASALRIVIDTRASSHAAGFEVMTTVQLANQAGVIGQAC